MSDPFFFLEVLNAILATEYIGLPSSFLHWAGHSDLLEK